MSLLVTPFAPALFQDNSCLSTSFYGNYRDGLLVQSVFLPEQSCLNQWLSSTIASSASITEAIGSIQQLVWVEEEAIDVSLKSQVYSQGNNIEQFLDRVSRQILGAQDDQEILVSSHDTSSYLLYRSQTALLLSVTTDIALSIDTRLPRFWRSTILPTASVEFVPIASHAVERISNLISSVKFNPEVAAIVNSISIPQMENDIRYLSGEDATSGIISRHSFAEGSRTAAAWLKSRFEETGASCELRTFLTGFAPNVVCRYSSLVNTTNTVLISAHYDSRGSFGMTRAPGADDDGSGTVGILAIARAIARKGVKFHSNVEIVAFAGEEQGLLGSKAYARELRAADANLTLVIQADMLAYHSPEEPAQLGLPDLIGTPEVSSLVAEIAALYSPELQVGLSSACCSDHQSFYEQGFPATQVFERAGPIIDPMYHNSGDLSNRTGYDLNQVKSIAKVQFSTVLYTAGFEIEK